MQFEQYDIRASESLMEFEFISVGTKGEIIKVVNYAPTHFKNVLNLALADKDPETGTISDSVISDNGDTKKVLVTVAYTALEVFKEFPGCQIFVSGLTPSRTRLYQMNISNNLKELSQIIDIKGLTDDGWETFKKGVNYNGFMVTKKR